MCDLNAEPADTVVSDFYEIYNMKKNQGKDLF